MFAALLALCEVIHRSSFDSRHKGAGSNAELWCFLSWGSEQTVEHIVVLFFIRNVLTLKLRHFDDKADLDLRYFLKHPSRFSAH